jgi:hypothetical protein
MIAGRLPSSGKYGNTENRTDMRPGGQFQREEFSRDQDQERNAARADS